MFSGGPFGRHGPEGGFNPGNYHDKPFDGFEPHERNGGPPPCFFLEGGGRARKNFFVVVLMISMVVLFVFRKYDRKKRRFGVWFLDLSRLLIADGISKAIFILVFWFTFKSVDQDNPDICRLPVLEHFYDTIVGVPLCLLAHRLVYAVSVRAIIGRIRYAPKDEVIRAGLASGHYGHPIRLHNFLKQTLVLTLSYTFARFVVGLIIYSTKSLDRLLITALLGWTWPMGPGAEVLIAFMVYPLLFFSVKYVVMDRYIRYRWKAKSKSNDDVEEDGAINLEQNGDELGQIEAQGSGEHRQQPQQHEEGRRQESDPGFAVIERRRRSSSSEVDRAVRAEPGRVASSTASLSGSPSSAEVEFSRSVLGSNQSTRAILTTILTRPIQVSDDESSTLSISSSWPPSYAAGYNGLLLTATGDDEPGMEDGLPTYADSQREAALSSRMNTSDLDENKRSVYHMD
ncbi:hypothetical protein V1514DRAFT_285987 [Lipomyces japonicus]|uniref:uncharacterized protein n=1 Tax=Lipomyces japonicus TaxID=56871 RepID=UPI0034CF0F7A